jgi:predicted P-loop ATPase
MQQYLHCGNIAPSISEYNTATYLVERMLVNVDDQMDHIFGKDYNSMKSIITADFVSRRTLYSKRAKNRRRIANFCGSVNESHFLRDSNNRRYLCFKIKDILPSYQDVDMDDVMAEVKMAADARGVRYVFGKEDFATIDQMNECFMTPTEEDEALHTCFAPTQAGQKGAYLMQFTELLKVLRQMTGNNQLRQFNLQTAMRKYGFESRMMRSRAHAYPCNLFAVSIVARDPDARNSLELLCRAWREEEILSWTDVSG